MIFSQGNKGERKHSCDMWIDKEKKCASNLLICPPSSYTIHFADASQRQAYGRSVPFNSGVHARNVLWCLTGSRKERSYTPTIQPESFHLDLKWCI